MPSLQIRELPEQIYRKLKQQSELEHRTLSQQAIVTLARGLNIAIEPISRRKHVLDFLKKNAQNLSKYELSDPVKLIREDRER